MRGNEKASFLAPSFLEMAGKGEKEGAFGEMKSIVLFRMTAMLLSAFTVFLWAWGERPKRPTVLERLRARYVGSDICFECHLDVARLWATLPHSRRMLDEKLPKHLQGCEACHGPGSWHVIQRRGNIIAWEKLSVPDKNAICLQCHERVTPEKWHTSPHGGGKEGERQPPACTDCHEVHFPVKRPWMLKAPSRELCLSCHAGIIRKAEKGLHHPVVVKPLQCAACHDAHDGSIPGMLKSLPTRLCRRCHDLSAIKPSDHTPAFRKGHGVKGRKDRCSACHGREGCQNCHGITMPHPRRFRRRHQKPVFTSPSVCVRCHTPRDCLKCHREAPPYSHDEEDYPKEGHAAEVKRRSLIYCSLCHRRPDCDACHRQKGIPLEVTRDALPLPH